MSADIIIPKYKIVIEIDSPNHFVTEKNIQQSVDVLTKNLLVLFGWKVKSMPFYEFN